MRRVTGIVLLGIAALLVGGCPPGAAPHAPPEPVLLETAGVAPSADVSRLATVLVASVGEDGRFRPTTLHKHADDLDAQLRLLAVSGPTVTPGLYPTEADRWAYWYNARVAWSLKLARLALGPDPPAEGPVAAPAWLEERLFPLDGRSLSLSAIDELLLLEARRSGHWRLAACAPGASYADAPLLNRPYRADDFPPRLSEWFDRLMADGRRVVIDIDEKALRVPPMALACRELAVRQYQRETGATGAELLTALRAGVSDLTRRRLDDALGYPVVARLRPADFAIPNRQVYFPGSIGKVER